MRETPWQRPDGQKRKYLAEKSWTLRNSNSFAPLLPSAMVDIPDDLPDDTIDYIPDDLPDEVAVLQAQLDVQIWNTMKPMITVRHLASGARYMDMR